MNGIWKPFDLDLKSGWVKFLVYDFYWSFLEIIKKTLNVIWIFCL